VVAALALWSPWRSAPVEITQQPAVRLDLDLGPDISFGSTTGPAVILSDGQWIGFFGQGKLKKTRIDGGESVTLCDAPNGRGASWGEDGTIIAALGTEVSLSQVQADGGKAIPVTTLNLEVGENTHRWPQVLQGGKAVLFNASNASGNYEEAEIDVVSLKDHRRKTVLEHAGMHPHYLPSGHLVYVTKGNLFAVPFDLERLEVRGPAQRYWASGFGLKSQLCGEWQRPAYPLGRPFSLNAVSQAQSGVR
jgi:hypothetical protein